MKKKFITKDDASYIAVYTTKFTSWMMPSVGITIHDGSNTASIYLDLEVANSTHVKAESYEKSIRQLDKAFDKESETLMILISELQRVYRFLNTQHNILKIKLQDKLIALQKKEPKQKDKE